jgi:hypothetical protein
MDKKLSEGQIFIKGAKFKANKIDFNSPDIKRKFQQIRIENDKILKQQKIDWVKLRNTFITI